MLASRGRYRSRYLLKASTFDFPRPWVWKTALLPLPVWLVFGQFWRVNHGAHLGALSSRLCGVGGYAGGAVGAVARIRPRGAS